MTNLDPDAYGNGSYSHRPYRPLRRRPEPVARRRIVSSVDEQLVEPGRATETVPVQQRPRQITVTRTTTFGTVAETIDAPATGTDPR